MDNSSGRWEPSVNSETKMFGIAMSRQAVTLWRRRLQCLEQILRSGGRAVEGGGLEKLKRHFPISLKIQLNPFASRHIARSCVFPTYVVFDRFWRVLVTIW